MKKWGTSGVLVFLSILLYFSLRSDSAVDGSSEGKKTDTFRIGLLSDSGPLESSIPYAVRLDTEKLPSSTSMVRFLPPSFFQGNQASSVGFVLGYSLKSYTENQKKQNPQELSRMSHEALVENNQIFSPAYLYNTTNAGKDQGGSLLEGLILLASHGVLPWADLPYRIGDFRSRSFLDETKSLQYRISHFRRIRISDLNQIKAYLSRGNPLPTSLLFYSSYKDYRKGDVLKSPQGEFLGAQAVLVAGFDDSKKAFLVQNSWGKSWGEDGYFWIDYKYFQKTAQSLYYVNDPPLLPHPDRLSQAYPEEILASDGNYADRVRISWRSVTGAIGYEVYRKRPVGGKFQLVGLSLEESFEDRGVQQDLSYQYKVATVFPDSSSLPSPGYAEGYSSKKPKPRERMGITGLTASRGRFSDRVALSWNPIPGVRVYHLYKYNPYSKQYRLLTKTTRPEYVDRKSNKNGSIEFYRVSVAGSYASSTISSAVMGYTSRRSMVLPPPLSINASSGEYSDKIKLEWEKVTGADSYKIYRMGKNSDVWDEITKVKTNSFEDKNPKSSENYYTVASVNRMGLESRGSVAVLGSLSSIREKSLALPPPYSFQTSIMTKTENSARIRLTWKSVPNAASYQVYTRVPGEKWKSLGKVDKTHIQTEIPSGKFRLFSVTTLSDSESESKKSRSIPYGYMETIPDLVRDRSFGAESNLEKFKGPWTTMYWDGKASITQINLVIRSEEDGSESCKILFNNKLIYRGEYIQESEIKDPKGRFQLSMGDTEQALMMDIKDKDIFPDTTTLSFLRE